MIPQQSPTNVVQIATSLAQTAGPNTPAVATFAQDRAAQIRFAPSFKALNQFILMVFLDINLLLGFVQYCERRREDVSFMYCPVRSLALTGFLLVLSCSPS